MRIRLHIEPGMECSLPGERVAGGWDPRAWTKNGEGIYVTFETNNSVGKAFRRALVCSASIAILGLSATPAFAQDEEPDAKEKPIVVTGSRLVIPSGMETA